MNKKILFLFSMILIILNLFSCNHNNEEVVNINKVNVIDMKFGIDTNNKDLITLEVDTDKFKKFNFGNIDNNPIPWYVIYEDNESLFLLSEQIIDVKSYDAYEVARDFDKTTLHNFLNNEFLNTHFSVDEKNRLLYTNDIDTDFVTMPTLNNLIDLFGDINYIYDDYYNNLTYFEANKNIIAKPSAKAINNNIGIFNNNEYAKSIDEENKDNRYDFANGYSPYWLLNQTDDGNVFFVTSTGYIGNTSANNGFIGVRPIIRIKK